MYYRMFHQYIVWGLNHPYHCIIVLTLWMYASITFSYTLFHASLAFMHIKMCVILYGKL